MTRTLDDVRRLARRGMLPEQIADLWGIDLEALPPERLARFERAWRKGRAALECMLLQRQTKLAERGNVQMLLLLGKEVLGQAGAGGELGGQDREGSPEIAPAAALKNEAARRHYEAASRAVDPVESGGLSNPPFRGEVAPGAASGVDSGDAGADAAGGRGEGASRGAAETRQE